MSEKIKVGADFGAVLQATDDLIRKFQQAEASGEQTEEVLQDIARAADRVGVEIDKAKESITRAVEEGKSLEEVKADLLAIGDAAEDAGKQLEGMASRGEKAAAANDKVGQAAGGLEAILAGLGLAAFGDIFGKIEQLTRGIKDIVEVGGTFIATFAKIATVIGALVAIVVSVYTVYQELQKTTYEVADANSLLDGTLLKVANSIGLINEEAVNLAEQNRKDDEALGILTDKYKGLTEAQIEAAKASEAHANRVKAEAERLLALKQQTEDAKKAVDDFVASLEASKADKAIQLKVEGIDSIEAAQSRLVEVEKGIRDLRNLEPEDSSVEALEARNKAILDGLRSGQVEIQALETRLQSLKAEEEAKKKEAEDAAKAAAKEAADRQAEAAKETLRQIEEEKAARLALIDEQQKKKAEAHAADLARIDEEKTAAIKAEADKKAATDRRLDAVLKLLEAQKGGGQGGGAAAGAPVSNPYGEGEAPTGQGGGGDPFGGLLGMQGLPDFGYGGRGVGGGFVDVGIGAELPSFGYQAGPGAGGGQGGEVSPEGLPDAITAELEKVKNSRQVIQQATKAAKDKAGAGARSQTGQELGKSLGDAQSGTAAIIREILAKEGLSDEDLANVKNLIDSANENQEDIGNLGKEGSGILKRGRAAGRKAEAQAGRSISRQASGEEEAGEDLTKAQDEAVQKQIDIMDKQGKLNDGVKDLLQGLIDRAGENQAKLDQAEKDLAGLKAAAQAMGLLPGGGSTRAARRAAAGG